MLNKRANVRTILDSSPELQDLTTNPGLFERRAYGNDYNPFHGLPITNVTLSAKMIHHIGSWHNMTIDRYLMDHNTLFSIFIKTMRVYSSIMVLRLLYQEFKHWGRRSNAGSKYLWSLFFAYDFLSMLNCALIAPFSTRGRLCNLLSSNLLRRIQASNLPTDLRNRASPKFST